MKPLVSVITATRSRHREIEEAVRQVRAQTYRPLEHIIVSDGPDPVLRRTMRDEIGNGDLLGVPIIFQETGQVWSDVFIKSDGAAAFQVAQLLGHGPWQMWFSDDEKMDPNHILWLMELIEETNSDFAYSKALWYTNTADLSLPRLRMEIGGPKPTAATITNCVYSTALLDYGKFETHRGRGTDWVQVETWLKAGARYAFLDRLTFEHRADQVGGVNNNTIPQRLRGHAKP